MDMHNSEFKSFLTKHRELFTAEELQTFESNDYGAAADILLAKRRMLPSNTRVSRLILSMMQGDVNLSIVKPIRANMFYPSQTAERYLLYLESCGSVIYGANHYTKRANMNSYLICHTFCGSGVLEYEDSIYRVSPGDAFIIDCRKPHYYYAADSQWGYDAIHFNGNAAAAYYLQIKRSNRILIQVDTIPLFMDALQLLRSYCESPDSRNEYTVNLALTSLLTAFTDLGSADQITHIPDWLKTALTSISTRYYESLDLDTIAHEVNISKYHLSKSIKSFTGKTFIEYLNQIRIEEAKKLLLTTNLPISFVSESVGFESESYFITLFKRREQLTPLQFRKQITT